MTNRYKGKGMENLYDILEVSRKASREVIDKAYKTLAKKYHPDLQAPENKQMAEEKMKKINEAYSVLSDDVQRARYDRELEEGENNRQKSYTPQQNTYENEEYNKNYYGKDKIYYLSFGSDRSFSGRGILAFAGCEKVTVFGVQLMLSHGPEINVES